MQAGLGLALKAIRGKDDIWGQYVLLPPAWDAELVAHKTAELDLTQESPVQGECYDL